MARARRVEPVQLRTSSRALGVAVSLLVHLLLAYCVLLQPEFEREQESPAALPLLEVRLIWSAATALPAPPPATLTYTPRTPAQKLPSDTPRLVMEAPVATNAPTSSPGEIGTTAPPNATPSADFQRSRQGLNPDCLPRGWLLQMSRRISFNLRRPAQARQLGEVGTVYMRVSVARDGRVLDARLLQSSGFDSLDDEANEVLRRISRFSPLPATQCADYAVIVVDQPIRFTSR